MVFNATFNNISVISWQLVLLVEETGITGESHRPVCHKSVTNYHLVEPNQTINKRKKYFCEVYTVEIEYSLNYRYTDLIIKMNPTNI
jgi:hypothetical protein